MCYSLKHIGALAVALALVFPRGATAQVKPGAAKERIGTAAESRALREDSTAAVDSLVVAAAAGDLATVRALVGRGVAVNGRLASERYTTLRGWSAVGVAAVNCHPAIVTELLEHGADVDAAWSGAMRCNDEGDVEDIFDEALKHGPPSVSTLRYIRRLAADKRLPAHSRAAEWSDPGTRPTSDR